MDDVKSVMTGITTSMAAIQKDGFTYSDRLHTIIMGNTGTGKTKLVHCLAAIYHTFGVIKQPDPIIYDAVDYADFSKNFDANFKKAKGNILCFENVQKLIPAGYSKNVEQLDRIFREMSKPVNRLDPIIILSGQPQGFREYLNANDNVKGKFRFIFTIPDFDSSQLAQMTQAELLRSGFSVPDDVGDKLRKVFKHILVKCRMPDAEIIARNAWLSLKMAEDIKTSYYIRGNNTSTPSRNISENDIAGDYDKEKTIDQVIAEIDAFIGMHGIKKAVRELIAEVGIMKERVAKGIGKEQSIGFHIVLTGNPGTGKTTVARKLGEIFKAIGVLDLGHVIEVARDKMVAQFVGQTAPQVNKLCDDAMGGILFIDEAYTLKQNDNDTFGQEAIDTLLKRMEDDRGKFIVVIAGYPKEITTFLSSNPGLESRFDRRFRFHLDDYNSEELLLIFKEIATIESYCLDVAAEELIRKQFTSLCAQKDKNFGNGREARNMFTACRYLHSQRMTSLQGQSELDAAVLTCFCPEDIPANTSVGNDLTVPMQELDKLIGLSAVKEEVRKLISYLQVEEMRAQQGGKDTKLNLHFVFRGNPGTGKTTVARILADVFKSMGLLSKGNLVEVDRAGLVAQYVGQTAPKTNAIIDAAIGGVLFIDEAYTLAGDTFGKEAIDTLLKRMEDNKGKFIAIAAGYFAEMDTFLNSNTGLTSRFTKFIDFEDYTPSEMKAIYHFMTKSKGMQLGVETDEVLDAMFNDIYVKRDRNFANGRTVRNIFEKSLQNQSSRLGPIISSVSQEDLNTLQAIDITL
jgi:SpoVK/Ycf46/Vps4 family AAA+-type ATPase